MGAEKDFDPQSAAQNSQDISQLQRLKMKLITYYFIQIKIKSNRVAPKYEDILKVLLGLSFLPTLRQLEFEHLKYSSWQY